MDDKRYAPPEAQVADVLQPERKPWARATWFHLIAFASLVVVVFDGADALELRTASGWGIAAALALTAPVVYLPARSLRALSATAEPWWTDALICAPLVPFLVGIVVGDVNLVVVGGTPVILANGILGILAVITERRHGLRVYASVRGYVFSQKSAL